jgi:catechol 2,3-dioxygenase-like lactoylglutathione lyase family enzyme
MTMNARIEHVNTTVDDLDRTLRFLAAAAPDWRVRGGGTMDWYGKPIRWVHVGTDDQYLALQSGGEGRGPDWRTHEAGVKHVGIVVPSVQAVVERLAAAGFAVDHWGGDTPHRRSVYVMDGAHLQFEFVEYDTDEPALRNVYGS